MNLPGLKLEGDLEALPWRATQYPGVRWLPLHLDAPGEGEGSHRPGATVLIEMAAGQGYAPHRHVGGEEVLVLAGGYRDEWGEYRQGDHVHYDPGSEHAPVALEGRACVLYATAPQGIELLETYTREDPQAR